MKVCQNCGVEISMRDGDNLCNTCDNAETRKQLKAQQRKQAKREREQLMRDMGLVKVRGALGGTYWE